MLRKKIGALGYTEPILPSSRVVREADVVIEFFLNDHGPPHLHVTEHHGESTHKTKIGQNGHPLRGQPDLTPKQRQVIRQHRRLIRKVVRKYSRWYWFHRQGT